jgi:hypothetical protein
MGSDIPVLHFFFQCIISMLAVLRCDLIYPDESLFYEGPLDENHLPHGMGRSYDAKGLLVREGRWSHGILEPETVEVMSDEASAIKHGEMQVRKGERTTGTSFNIAHSSTSLCGIFSGPG